MIRPWALYRQEYSECIERKTHVWLIFQTAEINTDHKVWCYSRNNIPIFMDVFLWVTVHAITLEFTTLKNMIAKILSTMVWFFQMLNYLLLPKNEVLTRLQKSHTVFEVIVGVGINTEFATGFLCHAKQRVKTLLFINIQKWIHVWELKVSRFKLVWI